MDFRPISFCNVVYKIASHAISNRFLMVLKEIIDDHQITFILGRLITNNIIVGFECMHWFQNHSIGNTRYVTLKLDISKAYDYVECLFV